MKGFHGLSLGFREGVKFIFLFVENLRELEFKLLDFGSEFFSVFVDSGVFNFVLVSGVV